MTSVIFPGQGSQFPGMARDFYDNFREFKDVFFEIEDSTKINLDKIIFDENPELLLFSKHRDDTFFDVLDQPPAKPRLILTKNHPLFVKAMQCETVADLVDCLTRSCLDGRQGTNNPEAFTHVDPETAEMLALKAARLHVSTVLKPQKNLILKLRTDDWSQMKYHQFTQISEQLSSLFSKAINALVR